MRDELLNVELFDTLLEAKVLIECWRVHVSSSQLAGLPPAGSGDDPDQHNLSSGSTKGQTNHES